MKRFLILGGLVWMAGWIYGEESRLPMPDLLWAIHQVENPENRTTPGAAGELGPHQIKREVWQTYSRLPHRRALEPRQSAEVAAQHLRWLEKQLAKSRPGGGVHDVALAWNAGLQRVQAGRVAPRHRDYARRVEALVQQRLAAAEQRRIELERRQALAAWEVEKARLLAPVPVPRFEIAGIPPVWVPEEGIPVVPLVAGAEPATGRLAVEPSSPARPASERPALLAAAGEP